ncbi:hypothetical protein N5J43_08280 [Pseudomonas nicosulfuronedens]|uniref:hypothetical protein n=1 Tax=Pseudomonas nicosulfuronedens TaxID=2571105 RepID=UPI00244C680B|nr:hypothetical protein [Pseudomonas nicosulfuronedens]MDH1009968.1 hypothetical protein [Pseudomonas nicosulfuronedens]MDH1978944.1 hypothetical protein [Pseudomonas nicosulfuronedens]MDH2028377.1 hypothetical protein [Pseudomonas nicosulfuronedens]
MTTIDWSKAPVGATHYSPSKDGSLPCWLRVSGELIAECWVGDRHFTYTNSQPTIPGERIPRPLQWDADGLPPVGTRCVFNLSRGTEWHKELRDGVEVEILAHYSPIGLDTVAVFAFPCPDGSREVEQAVAGRFSPLPTAEQIAAKAREQTIQAMLDADKCGTLSRTKFCNLLYDAGFRRLPSA